MFKPGKTIDVDLRYLRNPEPCSKCREVEKWGGWNSIDLSIYHDNDHRWPGYAGEPNGEDFGGSDF